MKQIEDLDRRLFTHIEHTQAFEKCNGTVFLSNFSSVFSPAPWRYSVLLFHGNAVFREKFIHNVEKLCRKRERNARHYSRNKTGLFS